MKNKFISAILVIFIIVNLFTVVGFTTESNPQLQDEETPVIKISSDLSACSGAEEADNIVSTQSDTDIFNVEPEILSDAESIGSDCYADDSISLGLQEDLENGYYEITLPSGQTYLTVRSGPGSTYGSRGSLLNGRVVPVLEVSGNWGRIVYNNNSNSWICLDYAVRVDDLEPVDYVITTVKTAFCDEGFYLGYSEKNNTKCNTFLIIYYNGVRFGEYELGQQTAYTLEVDRAGEWKFYLRLTNNRGTYQGSLTEGCATVNVYGKVSYDANGGTGAPVMQIKEYGQTLVLSGNVPSRFSYNFVGWATAANAIDADYYPGDMYISNKSIKLYAVWLSQDEPESSMSVTKTSEITYGGLLSYLRFRPSVDGYYAFEGHAEDEDTCGYIYDSHGNELAYDDDSGEGGNFKIVYYMVRDEEEIYHLASRYFSRSKTGTFDVSISRAYKISYNGNGGTDVPVPQYKTHDKTLQLSYVVPKKAGYKFNGWRASGISGTFSAGANFTVNKDVVLNAQWVSNIKASGTCGTNLSWVLDNNGLLTISGSGDMADYTSGTSPWYSYVSYIRNIEIQNGVNNVGNYAFYNCRGLHEVDMADSVVSIGDGAFYGCEVLNSAETSDELKTIGKNAFDGCKLLNFFTLPESVISIGESAFQGCATLADIDIPTGVAKIEKNTFYGCSGLVNVILPEGVSTIEQGAFQNCTDLRRLTLPKTLVSVKTNAFANCTRLEYVYYNSVRASWNNISVSSGNDALLNANLYFISNEMYTVTYDYSTNGGYSAGKLKATVKSGDRADLNVTAMKTGWTFVGWNTNPNQSDALTSYTVTSNVTLYAIYKKTITLKFYSGNNTLLHSEEATLVNNKITANVTAPNISSYSGWSPVGWRDDTEAGSYEWLAGSSISAGVSKSFYAVYRKDIVLTYNMNGNSQATAPLPASANQYYNAYGKKSNNTFVLASVTSSGSGKQFVAWSTSSQVNAGVNYEPGDSYTINESKTLYAVWADTNKCIITYKAGQYQIPGLTTKVEVTKGSQYTLPQYEAENLPEGVGFSEYSITMNNETVTKYPGDKITVNSNITIRIMFTLKLTTKYIAADSKVSASYNGTQENDSIERGFKYKKIDDSSYTTVKINTSANFETILPNLEAGYEYEVWAYDILYMNPRTVEVNGTKQRFKVNGDELTLNDTKLYLATGDSYVLVANVRGYDTNDIIWQSSNRNVATVKNGYISALSKGETYITATTRDGAKSSSCYVKVRNGRLPVDYNFSEWDLAMRLSSNGNDPDKCGADVEKRGANVVLGIAALANWKGITYEESNPYPTIANLTDYNENAPVAYHLQSAYMLPRRTGSNDLTYIKNIKRALVNYGAVYAAFNSFSECWNSPISSLRTNYYNSRFEETSHGAHAIAIVGWDDTYNKNRFIETPPGDGAFLCKNSYGEADCDDGYFYISYYDANLGITDEMVVFPGVGSNDNYKNIYSYDPYGPATYYEELDEIIAVNVFGSKFVNEDVEAVSFYTYEMGTNYEIYIIPNYTDKSMLNNLTGGGDGSAVLAASGTFDYAGYHTVKFNNNVPVTGNNFAVAVKLIKHGYYVGAYVELPIHIPDDSYTSSIYSKARANSGESYIYRDNVWKDISADNNQNNCIKAFTNGTVSRVNLYEETKTPSDEMYTVDELLEKGFVINPRFIEHIKPKFEFFDDVSDSGLDPSPSVFGNHDIALYANDVYPSSYSLKDLGYVTSVKNQLTSYGTCWAHAIYGSLESCMLRRTARTGSEMINNGLGDEDIVSNVTQSQYTSVSSVSLDKTSYTMAKGSRIKLVADVLPASADNREVSWTSSNKAVATVDIYGNVTAVAAGTAKITVITADGNKTASCTITVTSPVSATSIVLDNSISKNYNVGEYVFIHYSVYPTNAQTGSIVWTSSNESVAKVDSNGLVSALSNGTVTIRAQLVESGYTDEITLTIGDNHVVHVTDKKVVKEIIFNRGEKYTVSFSLDNIPDDANVMVCAYGSAGQMLDMKFADYKADYMEAQFDTDYISFVKIFVWDQNNSPLSVSDAIYT